MNFLIQKNLLAQVIVLRVAEYLMEFTWLSKTHKAGDWSFNPIKSAFEFRVQLRTSFSGLCWYSLILNQKMTSKIKRTNSDEIN